MNRGETERRVQEILEAVLGRALPAKATRKDIGEWDSLKHIQLVFALEEQHGVRFAENEIAELDSVSRFADAIQARRAT